MNKTLDSLNKERALLRQMRTCVSEMIDSAFLDATEMANDCLEVFDSYEWAPLEHLSDNELARWNELLIKGLNEDLGSGELAEFLSLTSETGEVHTYFHRVRARELVNEVDALDQPIRASELTSVSCEMQDHRVGGDEPVPEGEDATYQVNVAIGNQIGVEILDDKGEPSMGLLIEINHGVPAVHIDVQGGDSLVHIHKAQGGIVLSAETPRPFEQADADKFSGFDGADRLRIRA